MQRLSAFWKQDFVNKLIVIISVLLVLGISVVVTLFFLMPAGKSVTGMIGEVFPTRTLEPRLLLTRNAGSVMTQSAAATASVPPTITTMPFAPLLPSPTPGPNPILEPVATATLFVPTATLLPTLTPALQSPTPTLPPSRPSSSATPQIAGSPATLDCLPANPPQKGKVLDVLDGTTIKVLIDGFAYVVRYIGIEPPANPDYARLATLTNGDLVFAQEVTLIPDVTDKDENGRLLRYVKVGGKFPSLELLKKGLATAVDLPPNSACAKSYQSLEQIARDAKIGIWVPTPTLPAQ